MTGSFVVSIAIKATVVLVFGLGAVRIVHNSRAAVRHLILLALCAVILALPLAALVLPTFEVSLPHRVAAAVPLAVPSRDGAVVSPSIAATSQAIPSATGSSERMSFSQLLLMAEGVGAMVALLPLIVGLWQTRRLRASARSWPRGQVRIDRLAVDARISRPVDVLVHDIVPGPVTCGIWRPAILFPADVERWHDDDLDRAAIHELEHVRRHDWVTDCFARVVCAVYWFHPLVWATWRKLRLESERAGDDAVVREREATGYANLLLTFAERLATGPQRHYLIAMAGRGDLPVRIRAVLDESRPRGRAGAYWTAITTGAAILLIAVVAPLRAAAVPQRTAGSGNRVTVEVASIRLNTSGSLNRGTRGSPDGSVQVTNMSAMDLITFAYSIRESEVVGGPGWIRSSLYDIAAKPVRGATGEQIPELIRSLLEDRFQLRARRENREMPIYRLSVAQGGPRFGPAKEGSCGTEPAISPREIMRSCGYNMLSTATFDMLAAPIAKLVGALSSLTGRRVIDETGLTGTYSLHLDFAPEQSNDSSRPSIFTAVQEQLGLRLESSRGPIETLVIESIEKPTEN
jgi:uncharacterized protein (TIGR03435 family)